MTLSNAKKSQQLGMPWGTACNRLRKQILFALLERHSENICFKCSETIQSVGELSIEHKRYWLDVDPSLFWDLDNIAFSHLTCNGPDRVGLERQPKVGPEGTAWCGMCKAFLPIDQFHQNGSRWNGVHPRCKNCRSEAGEGS